MSDSAASQINRVILLDTTGLSTAIDVTGNVAALDVHFIPERSGIVVQIIFRKFISSKVTTTAGAKHATAISVCTIVRTNSDVTSIDIDRTL